jgi:hypothetical protein
LEGKGESRPIEEVIIASPIGRVPVYFSVTAAKRWFSPLWIENRKVP